MDWREVLINWTNRHGYAQVPHPPLSRSSGDIVILYDTSGALGRTPEHDAADRLREIEDHVDRTIAKWRA